jgi:lipoprotein-anchoring transpeptidase ErfK/SrfK
MNMPVAPIFRMFCAIALAVVGCQCATKKRIVVNVAAQRMVLTDDGEFVKSYPVSTSKFGEGDRPGSKKTPLGTMEVADKIGRWAPSGAVFKSRERTGEVLKPNAPGRDPIVSRILWLKGTQGSNRNAYRRYIYIHGTPEEYKIGSRASYGCIRMKSRDVIDLYRRVRKGTPVVVVPGNAGRRG